MEAKAKIKIAELMSRRGIDLLFPYDNKSEDLISVNDCVVEYCTLKYSCQSVRLNGSYRFIIRNQIKRLSALKNVESYFILCASRPDNRGFDFFKIPLDVVNGYFNDIGSSKCTYFWIQRLENGQYEIRPKYLPLDIERYRL